MSALRSVIASYRGPCGLCEVFIEDGDEIVSVDGEWCHAECAEGDGHTVTRDG